MKVELWERSYGDDSTFVFGTKPNDTVVKYAGALNRSCSVLDVGCGDGKNVLYLAECGFNDISAFDISESAIAKLKRLAERDGVKINCWVQDLREFEFDRKYDVIVSLGVLHFVPRSTWKRFIEKAKENTNPGGVHIIQLFTKDLPPTKDIADYTVGMAYDGEIREMYDDWEVLKYQSYIFEEEHPGVPLHSHSSNKIVVKNSNIF